MKRKKHSEVNSFWPLKNIAVVPELRLYLSVENSEPPTPLQSALNNTAPVYASSGQRISQAYASTLKKKIKNYSQAASLVRNCLIGIV